MTAERPADVAALTEAERLSLAYAVTLHTGYPSPRGANDLSSVTTTVDDAVETILAARVAAAYAEGDEAGRAEVTAAVEALHSALERTEANFVRAVNGKPVRDMAETLAENRAVVAAAPTLATIRADAGRDVWVEDVAFCEFDIDDAAEAVGDDHA